jgi:GT2 family glycosyltransferase
MVQCINPTEAGKQWPRVTIVVINYNGGAHLVNCLDTVFKDPYPDREIVVVDNASTDESRLVLEEISWRHPEITVIWSSQNLGYAGGVNVAVKSAQGAYIAVLNMDVEVAPGWLNPLVDFLETHPRVGAVSPLIALMDRQRINAVGQDVQVTGLGFNRWLGYPLDRAGRSAICVPGIQGAAFLISRKLLEKIGGLDPFGFLYHEDINLSWLLRLMGCELYCVPTSVVFHDYFLSMYSEKFHLLERNRWAMLLAYCRYSTLALLSPFLLLTELLVWGYSVLRGGKFVRAKWNSYRWVAERRAQIRDRRQQVDSLRATTDWEVLKKLRWAYAWNQLWVLGRERGQPARLPAGGIPKEMANS